MPDPQGLSGEVKAGVYLIVGQAHGAIQLSISKLDENGCGHGYRISGPKFDGTGKDIHSHLLTPGDADEISQYLSQVTGGDK
jgi:hypothetical protein